MKAFQYTNPAAGLVRTKLPVPVPERNQVLVKIKAAGLCHTDCNIISGKINTFFWVRPITMGHEIAGEIVEIGSDVTKFKVGDQVVSIITVGHPVSFRDVLSTPGIGTHGGFAEYVTLAEHKTLRIPEGVTFAQAAVATDAMATAYHAIAQTKMSKGSNVAIIGLGGLGLSAVQLASRSGATIYGIDLDKRKFLGAIQAGALSCARSLNSFSGVKFDYVLDFAGAGVTTVAAIKAVKPGAKVVLVGLTKLMVNLPTDDFIALGITLQGCSGASIEEVEKCLQLVATKEFVPLIEEVRFDDIREELDRLASGNVVGRLFTDPTRR